MGNFDFNNCVVNNEEKKVLCLDSNGDVYRFPLPEKVAYKDCNPCDLRKLIEQSIRKRKENNE